MEKVTSTDMKVIAHTSNINATKNEMLNKYNELLSMLRKQKTSIEGTKNIYDTDSGLIYRKLASIYIDLMEKYLTSEFKPYIDKLTDIERIYMETITAVGNSVNGDVQ